MHIKNGIYKSAKWWASLPGDDTVVNMYKPDNGNVFMDPHEARFRLSYQGMKGAHKSVSWTKIGLAEAVRESLRVMWSWAGQCGVDCPLSEEWIGKLTA